MVQPIFAGQSAQCNWDQHKSNAKLKIGMFSSQDIMKYDLLFKLKIKSLNYFIEQLTYYLELINKNNEK